MWDWWCLHKPVVRCYPLHEWVFYQFWFPCNMLSKHSPCSLRWYQDTKKEFKCLKVFRKQGQKKTFTRIVDSKVERHTFLWQRPRTIFYRKQLQDIQILSNHNTQLLRIKSMLVFDYVNIQMTNQIQIGGIHDKIYNTLTSGEHFTCWSCDLFFSKRKVTKTMFHNLKR